MTDSKFKSAYVKPLRDITGDTQASLASRVGCRDRTISQYETTHHPEYIQGGTAILLNQVADDHGITEEQLKGES